MVAHMPEKSSTLGFYEGSDKQEVQTMKVIVLGKSDIGKTALSRRYVHDDFTNLNATTIGAAFGAKRILVNGKPVVMGIWDTAGSERYEAMSRIYYRGARAAIVCYDITDKSSFNRLQFWVTELQKNEADCRIYLCGTKKDLIDKKDKPRQVDVHDARNFAADINAEIFETSSKTGENIGELFNKIAQDYSEDQINNELIKRSTVDITSDAPKSKCKC